MITITPDSVELAQVISCSVPTKVRKTAVTLARVLTPDDAEKCFISPHRSYEKPVPHHVWTKEGLVRFEVGDILCKGVEDEYWPMKPEEFFKIKVRNPVVPQDDADGWGIYNNVGFSYAIKMDQAFKVQIWNGTFIEAECGDYLLYSPDRKTTWAVGASIYAKSWAPAE